jgi:hypothetical protein
MPWHHLYAIDGTRRQAQLASGAAIGNDRVHALRQTDNRVDRAGFDAAIAADTDGLIDQRPVLQARLTKTDIERQWISAEQIRQSADSFRAAWRAPIDIGNAVGNGFGVGPTAGIATLGTLDAGQQVLDGIGG